MRRPSALLLRSTAAIAVAAAAVLLGVPMAAAEPGFSPIQAMPLPSSHQPPGTGYNAVSCASTSSCTAVGGHAGDEGDPYLATESSGTWGPLQNVALPAGAAGKGSDLEAVSCPSIGNCLAVGHFEMKNGATAPLLVAESSGTWGTARSAKPPPDALAGASEYARFTAVWCASAGNCVASGFYSVGPQMVSVMVAVEKSGIWGAPVALPQSDVAANVISFVYVRPPVMACTSTGSCTVILWGTSWTETHGTWANPVPIISEPFFTAYGVACPSSTTCIAVGTWTDANPPGAASFIETHGTWGVLDQRWPGDISWLSAISCQRGVCVTVGGNTADSEWDPHPYQYDMAATWSDGSWSSTALAKSIYVSQISCPATTQCLAISSGYSEVVTPIAPVVAPAPPGGVDAKPILRGVTASFLPPLSPYDDGGAPISSYTATVTRQSVGGPRPLPPVSPFSVTLLWLNPRDTPVMSASRLITRARCRG